MDRRRAGHRAGEGRRPLDLPLNPDQWLYLFSLGITVLMVWLAANLLRGRFRRAMIAIRDNPIAASAMGVNTAYYKSMTFGISAMYTGVAGALGAIVVQFVAPDSFTLFVSISFIVGIVVGGLATISGAFFGALFIEFVPISRTKSPRGRLGQSTACPHRLHVCDAGRRCRADPAALAPAADGRELKKPERRHDSRTHEKDRPARISGTR